MVNIEGFRHRNHQDNRRFKGACERSDKSRCEAVEPLRCPPLNGAVPKDRRACVIRFHKWKRDGLSLAFKEGFKKIKAANERLMPLRSPKRINLTERLNMSDKAVTPQWMIEQGCSPTLAERFYKKINVDGPIPEHRPELGKCHVWIAAKYPDGYGHINAMKMGRKLAEAAHRIAWMIVNGPILGRLFVLHKCDNKACVNPAHLFLGTAQDNSTDMLDKGRHKFTVLKDGQRGIAAKLTWEQVREIRQLYANGGIYQRELGAMFGVCQSHISDIVLGNVWLC